MQLNDDEIRTILAVVGAELAEVKTLRQADENGPLDWYKTRLQRVVDTVDAERLRRKLQHGL